jgi:NAD(P)-dependent dehydrogenase (short-subunit alcohol dehydrogenase family)
MLQGKTALVTGSTSGIGLGIAKALAAQGANIVLNGFGDVESPTAEVSALGAKVVYHGADMSKPAEIADMMAYAASQFGQVDILVNNAGIQHVCRMSRHFRQNAGTPFWRSTSAARFTPPAWPCPRCRRLAGDASSTWHLSMAWSVQPKNPRMWRPNTVWWASPR